MADHGKQDLYQQVSNVISKEEFDMRIQEEILRFGGLVDETAAAMVVVDKLDPYFFSDTTVAALEKGTDATLYAAVDYIGDTRTFDRGRVVNIVIGDNADRCVLVLWDANVGLAGDDQLKPGSIIKIINGYVKYGFYGLEVNIGRWGFVDLAPIAPPDIILERTPMPLLQATRGVVDAAVTVCAINPTQIFFTSQGELFVAVLQATDDSGERDITLWNEMARKIQQYQPGDKIHLSRLYVKQGRLHGGDISEIRPFLPGGMTSSP